MGSMDFITDILNQLDFATYNHWDILKPILDFIIPDAMAHYQP